MQLLYSEPFILKFILYAANYYVVYMMFFIPAYVLSKTIKVNGIINHYLFPLNFGFVGIILGNLYYESVFYIILLMYPALAIFSAAKLKKGSVKWTNLSYLFLMLFLVCAYVTFTFLVGTINANVNAQFNVSQYEYVYKDFFDLKLQDNYHKLITYSDDGSPIIEVNNDILYKKLYLFYYVLLCFALSFWFFLYVKSLKKHTLIKPLDIVPSKKSKEAKCPFHSGTIESKTFSITPIKNPIAEAVAFMGQYAKETKMDYDVYKDRISSIRDDFSKFSLTSEELSYGAQLAWRNSVRCIGRQFWRTLKVRDKRSYKHPDTIFKDICDHIEFSFNGGQIRPAITVYDPKSDCVIINAQLILYAGYKGLDGTIIGDPKNVGLTRLAISLGWMPKYSEFDILPLIMKFKDEYFIYEYPEGLIHEVVLEHPKYPQFKELGLKWFALPAVSSMAFDCAGVQYKCAPSSGIYMGTEIACFNLADPSRYNKLKLIAEILDIDTSSQNPLWQDSAMLELNNAVLHSFGRDSVSIMDHYTLGKSFSKFIDIEEKQGRKVYGQSNWILPPMGGNLHDVFWDNKLQKKILKPNFFYQSCPIDINFDFQKDFKSRFPRDKK